MSKPIEISGEVLVVPIDRVHPDPMNPNKMTEDQEEKLLRSLTREGLTVPILVRDHPDIEGHYMIVDGEHRWKKMRASGSKQIRVVYDPKLNDPYLAHQALLVHNYVKGQPELQELSAIVRELESSMEEFGDSVESLLGSIPLEREQWNSLMDVDFSVSPLPMNEPSLPAEHEVAPKEPTYTFRMEFSDDQRLRSYVTRMLAICEEAGLTEMSPSTALEIPVAYLGDVVGVIVNAVKISVLAERVRRAL